MILQYIIYLEIKKEVLNMARQIKQWSVKDFQKLLSKNGYVFIRQTGSHAHYINAESDHIGFPICSKEVNMMLARRLIKEHNLKW